MYYFKYFYFLMKKSEKEEFLLSIGNKLKYFRIRKGYSNHETFADDIDMTRSQYWEYENGNKNITILTLKRILDKLEIDFIDFFSN